MFEFVQGLVDAGYDVTIYARDDDGDYQARVSIDGEAQHFEYGKTIAEALGRVVTQLIPTVTVE